MARPNSAQKILDTASKLFAMHGFAGTIMDELALTAGVNKATIYYHFKDKEALYEQVLLSHASELVKALKAAVASTDDVFEKIDRYVQTFADQCAQRPHLTSILMREIAGGGTQMPDSAKGQMYQVVMTVKSIIIQGVSEGLFTECNPLVIHFMIIGTLSFYITSEPIRKVMVASDPDILHAFRNSTAQEVATQLSKMIKNALLKKDNQ